MEKSQVSKTRNWELAKLYVLQNANHFPQIKEKKEKEWAERYSGEYLRKKKSPQNPSPSPEYTVI